MYKKSMGKVLKSVLCIGLAAAMITGCGTAKAEDGAAEAVTEESAEVTSVEELAADEIETETKPEAEPEPEQETEPETEPESEPEKEAEPEPTYVLLEEYQNCDYDSDGLTDSVYRGKVTTFTTEYRIEFGNGDIVDFTGAGAALPVVQGKDLNGDGINEVLVTVAADNSSKTASYGRIWLYEKKFATDNYSEAKLPLADNGNGNKEVHINYEKPFENNITFTIEEKGEYCQVMMRPGENYIKNNWTDGEKSEVVNVYHAEFVDHIYKDDNSKPGIRCYIEPFPGYEKKIAVQIVSDSCGKYEISTYVVMNAHPGEKEQIKELAEKDWKSEDDFVLGTFHAGENGTVMITPGHLEDNDIGTNSFMVYEPGAEDLCYELSDDVAIEIFNPANGCYLVQVDTQDFLDLLRERAVDCHGFLNEEGKIDRVYGVYYA